MAAISEHRGEIGELPVFWRQAPAGGGSAAQEGDSARAPVLYLHGVPTSSDEWLPFLQRTGGLAPDLPGFGRSGKPNDFDYSMEGYTRFLEQYLELVGVERVRLAMHDWGGLGLVFAQRHPERVERLVLMNAVPLLPGYRWHRLARIWRMPVVGELAMGASTRPVVRLITRESNVTPGPMPEPFIDSVMSHFEQGTQRAILRLYRSAPPRTLAAAGLDLAGLQMPALVVWGKRDPYIPVRFGQQYAQVLPAARLIELEEAGHWWWLDRPEAIEQVVEFLQDGELAQGGAAPARP